MLQKTIQQAPALREIETLSADLAAVSQIGLEALAYINAKKQDNEINPAVPASNWYNTSLATLQAAKKPRGKTELMVVSEIEDLVKLATGR